MKIAKRDKQILLIFLGIALAVLAFYFVFLPGKEKAAALMTENGQLLLKITELEQLAAMQAQFEAETAEMTERINEIYDEFQTDFRSEDAFMLGRTVEEEADNTLIMGITVDNQEVVYDPLSEQSATGVQATDTAQAVDGVTDGATAVGDTGTGNGTAAADGASAADPAAGVELPRAILYKKAMSLTHSCTSEGLKDIIDYITLNTNKMTIESLSVSFDSSTGLLNGNTAINVYLLQGTNKPYTPWTIPDVQKGTDNIFGTLNLPSNVRTEDNTDTEEEEPDAGEEDAEVGDTQATDTQAADTGEGAA